MNKILLLLLLPACCLAGCEYAYQYDYRVTNNSDQAITIQLKTTHATDTTVFIGSDSTAIIFSTTHGVEGANGPHYKDVNSDLQSFTATKNGTASSRNYLNSACWTFSKQSKSTGVYATTVSNSEF